MVKTSSEVVQSLKTLCDPMDCSMPGFPVLHYLPVRSDGWAQIQYDWGPYNRLGHNTEKKSNLPTTLSQTSNSQNLEETNFCSGEYQADERAGVARLRCRVSGR